MADTKVTGLSENTDPQQTDVLYIVDDPGGSPASEKVTIANIKAAVNDVSTDTLWNAAGDILYATGSDAGTVLAVGTNGQYLTTNGSVPSWGAPPDPYIVQGRMTLTSATPVTTADVTGGTVLYFTPYKGDKIGLYDGSSAWDVISFTETSFAIPAGTANYDLMLYNNSGTLAGTLVAWTDATNRATALTTQNGVYVMTGATTHRYVGTIRVVDGAVDDSVTKRFVWNYYNRLPRIMHKVEATTHNYTTGSWRAWNNDTTQKVEFVLGVLEEGCTVTLYAQGETSLCNIGFDSFTDNRLAGCAVLNNNGSDIGAVGLAYTDDGVITPNAVGYHYYGAQEYGYAGATQLRMYINATING